MPAHHAPDEILIAYAAGSLGASESLLIACHLTLCPRCRALVADAEVVGAALLADPALASVAPGGPRLKAMLARLDEEDSSGVDDEPPAVDPRGVVPAPLFRCVGDIEAAPWRRLRAGVHMLDVPVTGSDKHAKLLRFGAGMHVPVHSHPGFEGTLVLAGGYTDHDGHYVRGDLSLLDHSRPHEQHIDSDGPCTWLVVADGRPIPRTLRGWLRRLTLRG